MIFHLTRGQRLSLAIHGIYAAVPFVLGAVEAYRLWLAALGGDYWLLAMAAVGVVDVICLVGLIVKLSDVRSPLALFRYLLPVVSFVPVAWGGFSLMWMNGVSPWIAGLVALGFAGWLGNIDRLCIREIERLFTPVGPAVAIDPTMALIDDLKAKVAAAQQVQQAYFDLVATGQQALVAQAHSLAAPAPQAPTELVVVPPERPADPLWPAKVEAWRMKPGSSWEVVAARFDKSTSTVRGWVAQVEEAING